MLKMLGDIQDYTNSKFDKIYFELYYFAAEGKAGNVQ